MISSESEAPFTDIVKSDDHDWNILENMKL